MYLNDELAIEKDDEVIANQEKNDLINSGFVPKVEKSLWKPTKRLFGLVHLSIVKQYFYKIPDQRIDKILYTIKDIRTCLATRKTVYVRKVASFAGQIISTYSVNGNIAYLMTKDLTIDNNKSLAWYSYIKLSESIEQLSFWK